MGNNFSCCLPKKQYKKLQPIKNQYEAVLHSYIKFLEKIADRFSYGFENEREERKFNEIKKELVNFIFRHRQFLKIRDIWIAPKSKRNYSDTVIIKSSFVFKRTFKRSDFLRLSYLVEKYPNKLKINYRIRWEDKKILEVLKDALKKSIISNEDVQHFLENHFLVDRHNLETKCLNYIELKHYNINRTESYIDRRVSTLHIEQMSFDFSGSIEGFEEEKSCAVCMEDYELNQQVCRLPCNHFCCRNCTENMFSIPEDINSNAYFQCPICRADCT